MSKITEQDFIDLGFIKASGKHAYWYHYPNQITDITSSFSDDAEAWFAEINYGIANVRTTDRALLNETMALIKKIEEHAGVHME